MKVFVTNQFQQYDINSLSRPEGTYRTFKYIASARIYRKFRQEFISLRLLRNRTTLTTTRGRCFHRPSLNKLYYNLFYQSRENSRPVSCFLYIAHLPHVKSGIATGAPPMEIDCSESAVILIHAAVS